MRGREWSRGQARASILSSGVMTASTSRMLLTLLLLCTSESRNGLGGSGIVSVRGQSCTSTETATMIGENSTAWDSTYFACADGEFIVAFDVWYYTTISHVRITCSDGEMSALPDNIASYDNYGEAVFDVGITSIEGRSLPEYDSTTFLGDVYFTGYTSSSSGGVTAETSGPFGVDDDYTATTTSTECPSDAYATGATFLDTGNFVLAIQLECAPVTSTCAPSVVVASDTDDGVDGYGGVTATDDSDDSDGLLGGYADDDDDYTYVVPDDDDGDGTLIDTQESDGDSGDSSEKMALIIGGSVGGAVLLCASVIGIIFCVRRCGPDPAKKTSEPKVSVVHGVPALPAVPGTPVGPPPAYESPPPAEYKAEW